MNIGEAAAASAVSAKMIRHYEALGLVPGVRRAPSGLPAVRRGDGAHAALHPPRARPRLRIHEIAALLALWHNRGARAPTSSASRWQHVRRPGTAHREMQAMQRTLAHLAHCCHGDERPDCPILDDLAGA